MAITDYLLRGATQDLVAIYDDESFSQVFASASPMVVLVNEEKRITEFPVEDGSTMSDHVVTELVDIAMELLLTEDTRNGYEELRAAFAANRLLTVQTKVTSYPSMLIEAIPHIESIDTGDAIRVPVRFIEWKTVTPELGEMPKRQVANPKQSSTVDRGQQQTTEATPEQKKKVDNGGIASQAYDGGKNWWNNFWGK